MFFIKAIISPLSLLRAPLSHQQQQQLTAAAQPITNMNSKTLLLLALIVCSSSAQNVFGGTSRCLCRSFRDNLGVPRKLIKSLEVIAPSNSCDNLEIILNLTNGKRLCLNPSAQKIRDILNQLRTKRGTSKDQ
ncbi:hypothetical protein GJAV_G00195330 [Gymnothorax javanicus]|nr:hypothetical protein GJAV_G00195330 [Gymnothorax javanicus]